MNVFSHFIIVKGLVVASQAEVSDLNKRAGVGAGFEVTSQSTNN